MSKTSRDELIQDFVAAIRASQTATEMLDSAVANYLGISPTDYRAIDILDQEGPMTAGQLAARARLSPGAITSLVDRLESKGLARRTRDTVDRRRVLIEVTPELRKHAIELYGTPQDAASGLAHYTDEQLELLTGFLRGSVEFQEERLRRLEEIKGRGSRGASPGPRKGAR